jgi:hypothetical protein
MMVRRGTLSGWNRGCGLPGLSGVISCLWVFLFSLEAGKSSVGA